jgi:hypothetical protein
LLHDALVVRLGHRIDQVAQPLNGLESAEIELLLSCRRRRSAGYGQRLVDQEARDVAGLLLTHDSRHVRGIREEQLDREVRQDAAVHDLVACDFLALVCAPVRTPFHLLPHQRDAHGHPDGPFDGTVGRGAVVEHE